MDIQTVLRNVAAVAESWSGERAARLARQALDQADFDALADAGLTLTGVKEDMGGVWNSPEQSSRTSSRSCNIGPRCMSDSSTARFLRFQRVRSWPRKRSMGWRLRVLPR